MPMRCETLRQTVIGKPSKRLNGFSRAILDPSRRRFGSQDNTHLVSQCVVTQRHDFVGCRDSIQFHQGDTSGTVVWILDRDAINGVLETVSQTEARPIFRYDRIDRERVAAALEYQNFFEPDAIGPSRCARIPRPPTAPNRAS